MYVAYRIVHQVFAFTPVFKADIYDMVQNRKNKTTGTLRQRTTYPVLIYNMNNV